MTEITWCKLFHDFADDAKFLRVADITGATVELVQACFARALCRASSNPDRGSTKNIDLEEFAWWFKKPVEVIRSILDAFERVGRMITDGHLANWAKRQGAAVTKLAKAVSAGAVSAGAERTRRYRQRKATDERQGRFEFAQAARHDGLGDAEKGVTPGVTVTAEKEGRAQRTPQSSLNTESSPVAARKVVLKNDDTSLGRAAPPSPLDHAVKVTKRKLWLTRLQDWALRHFTGSELDEAQTLIWRAGAAAASDAEWRARPPAERKWLDRLDRMRRGKEPKRPVVLMPSMGPEPEDELPQDETSAVIYRFDRKEPPILPGRKMVLDEIERRYSPEQVAAFHEAWSWGGERARHAEEMFEKVRQEIGAPLDDPLFGLTRVA